MIILARSYQQLRAKINLRVFSLKNHPRETIPYYLFRKLAPLTLRKKRPFKVPPALVMALKGRFGKGVIAWNAFL